mmetsp:Transcript_122724/g.192645  ORF Transcript_122724/g.192645 Transcript_122724/m.192645 type:complete len:413 (-) Transcript_122724:110-1348(-)
MAFLVGITLEIISGMVGVIGKQLIGFSARHRQLVYARVVFAAGMIMTTVLGAVLDAVAMGFAPQSILAPLHGLEISMNVVFAPCVLQEKPAAAHIIGALLVSAGASLTALYGPHNETPVSLEALEEKILRWQVGVYVIVFCCGVLVCFSVLRVRPRGTGDKLRGLILGVVAGGIAGNVCFLKCTMGLLGLGLGGDWSPWKNWLPYALAVLAASVALGNVPLMVTAMEEYEALFMVTVFGGANIVMACISGAVVLCEMDDVDAAQTYQYWASVFLIICGLVAINTAEVHAFDICDGEEVDASTDVLSPMRAKTTLPITRRGSIGSMHELRARSETEGRVAVLWATPVSFRAAGKTPRSSALARSRTWTGMSSGRARQSSGESTEGHRPSTSFHLDGPAESTGQHCFRGANSAI